MSDAAPSLYATREPVFPRRVQGRFRRLKWAIMAVTLGIYYVTPWLRWDRGPELPDQAVLVDLAGRRFFFFWIEIWPHEFYFIAGLLIMAGLGLFLFTSALGRVWCGYTCPQTVWTDLFIWIERLVIGDRNARIKLDNSPWTARKARLKVTVHAIWLAIAVATGGAWIFYFADAPTLAAQFIRGDAAPAAYITVAILTFTTYTLAGTMRVTEVNGWNPDCVNLTFFNAGSIINDFDSLDLPSFPVGHQALIVFVPGNQMLRFAVSPESDWNRDGILDTSDFINFLNDWVANEPQADFNGDSLINTSDFIAFLNLWNAPDPDADFNHDGVVDTRDVILFLNIWSRDRD